MFLLNVLFFGLNSALTILASQYWGKRDTNVISKILGIGLIISLAVTVTVAGLAFFFPYTVIRIWTDVPELIDAVTVFSGIIAGVLLLVINPFIPGLVKITETAAHYLRVMLYISVAYQMGQIVNTVLIASLFRCGGDSKYGMILDAICMWGFAVPLGLISAFVFKWPPLIVYVCMCMDEFAKMPFAIRHYKSGGWIKNITREIT